MSSLSMLEKHLIQLHLDECNIDGKFNYDIFMDKVENGLPLKIVLNYLTENVKLKNFNICTDLTLRGVLKDYG